MKADYPFLTEEHQMLRDSARQFAEQVLLPTVIERDIESRFPTEEVRQMAEMGFMGMEIKPEYGGMGMDSLAYVIALEEIAAVDASAAVIMSVNNSLVSYPIQKWGTEAQKQKYLPKLAAAEWIGAFCLSEPEAGSDATQQRTTAEDKGDYFLINGTKNWITNGTVAGLYLVFAQTDPAKRHKGITAFLVERDREGVVVGKKEDKMGIRSSDTASIMFQDVKVPKENILGEVGQGFKIAMQTLNVGRIGIAAQALGIAKGAFERALSYSQERKAFGKPIAEHQAVAFKLADMATRIESARLLVYRAAYVKSKGEPNPTYSAMAKAFASETATYVTKEAVQIHGGYGYVREYHVERMMRDAKITEIYEGTNEIQRIVISRALLKH